MLGGSVGVTNTKLDLLVALKVTSGVVSSAVEIAIAIAIVIVIAIRCENENELDADAEHVH